MRSPRAARVDTARAAAALNGVIDETRALFHRLKRAAERLHEAEHLTAGERAVLVELAQQGPRTVPAMARARPVSRQHIQVLVNLLLERGLVALVQNPQHQRSKLIQLTQPGNALATKVRAREKRVLTRLGRALDPVELEQAANILGRVGQLFEEAVFRRFIQKKRSSRA